MSLPADSQHEVSFGPFEVDLLTAELRTNGRKAILRGQPFQILMVFLERPGELVTRQELKKLLWTSDTFVDFEHSLNKALSRLREALNDSADQPKFVETIPRKGYRWIGPIVRNGNEHDTRENRSMVHECGRAPAIQDEPQTVTKPGWFRSTISFGSAGRTRTLWKVAIPAGGLALVFAIGFFILRWRTPPSLTEKDSVVLADFVNRTGDPIFDDTLKQGLSAQRSAVSFL